MFELDEKRTCPSVFLPLLFTKKVPKDEDENKRVIDLLILYNNHYRLIKKLRAYIGTSRYSKLCRIILATESID